MTDLQPLTANKASGSLEKANSRLSHVSSDTTSPCRSPSAITFVRNRMFYARAALNAKDKVRFGFRHIRSSPSH